MAVLTDAAAAVTPSILQLQLQLDVVVIACGLHALTPEYSSNSALAFSRPSRLVKTFLMALFRHHTAIFGFVLFLGCLFLALLPLRLLHSPAFTTAFCDIFPNSNLRIKCWKVQRSGSLGYWAMGCAARLASAQLRC